MECFNDSTWNMKIAMRPSEKQMSNWVVSIYAPLVKFAESWKHSVIGTILTDFSSLSS
jgi:hypothetical protein